MSHASYAGDKTFITHDHRLINGDIIFTLGNSTYSGVIQSNDSYLLEFLVNLPNDATVIDARLYLYWVWSKKANIGVFPVVNASFGMNISHQNQIVMDTNYTDIKGFVGYYDYYSGVYCYNVTEYVPYSHTYYVNITNVADDNRTFCIQGMCLLIVFQDERYPLIEYWIKEGFDMLYADYGITPEMATTNINFEGIIDLNHVVESRLTTIVPGAGYNWNPQAGAPNRLFFNYESGNLPPIIRTILELLFGDLFSRGRMWENIYCSNQSVEIAIDTREVTNYLKQSNNIAQIQDNQDYMTPTNAILIIEYSSDPRLPIDPFLIFFSFFPYYLLAAFGLIIVPFNRNNQKYMKYFNHFTLFMLSVSVPFIILSNIYVYLSSLSYSFSYFIIPPFSFFQPICWIYLMIPLLNSVFFLHLILSKKRNGKKSYLESDDDTIPGILKDEKGCS
ncbi:MAG: DUF3344 domain-containing protein [Promethearchaeota archaeon]